MGKWLMGTVMLLTCGPCVADGFFMAGAWGLGFAFLLGLAVLAERRWRAPSRR